MSRDKAKKLANGKRFASKRADTPGVYILPAKEAMATNQAFAIAVSKATAQASGYTSDDLNFQNIMVVDDDHPELASLEPLYIAWQKTHLDSLAIGAKWVVPKNGFCLTKIADNAVEITNNGHDTDDASLDLAICSKICC